jgi:hypothetical protein
MPSTSQAWLCLDRSREGTVPQLQDRSLLWAARRMNGRINDIQDPVTVRDAVEADLGALQTLSGTRALHADRIREALLGWMQYWWPESGAGWSASAC